MWAVLPLCRIRRLLEHSSTVDEPKLPKLRRISHSFARGIDLEGKSQSFAIKPMTYLRPKGGFRLAMSLYYNYLLIVGTTPEALRQHRRLRMVKTIELQLWKYNNVFEIKLVAFR
jgi:hypothetical protein